MNSGIWINVGLALFAGLSQGNAHASADSRAQNDGREVEVLAATAMSREEFLECLQLLDGNKKPIFGEGKPCFSRGSPR
jgi:hypothetical protein